MRGKPGSFLAMLARRLTKIEIHGQENLAVLEKPGPAMIRSLSSKPEVGDDMDTSNFLVRDCHAVGVRAHQKKRTLFLAEISCLGKIQLLLNSLDLLENSVGAGFVPPMFPA